MIRSPLQLQQRRVVTLEGTSGVELAERSGMRVVKAENLDQGIDLLLSEQAEVNCNSGVGVKYKMQYRLEMPIDLGPGFAP